MSFALLFPGQGTQQPAMLPWLEQQAAAAPTLAAMADLIGADWRSRLADAAWAGNNRVAQCLITGTAIAAWQSLSGLLPRPAVIAGYSVGELAAFCAAGVFNAATALALAVERAEAMSASVAGKATGLLAVSGPPSDAVARACERLSLAVAIRLAADKFIVGGLDGALNAAQSEWTAQGANCTRLAIAVASHTPLMAAASSSFSLRLKGLHLSPPTTPLVCNFSASTLRRPADLAAALAGQIARTVRWDACLDAVAERRPRCVVEVGPGTTLSRLWNERHPDIPARSIDEFRSPAAVARWVNGVLA
jgi:[acyl-carrier-protein] S-malonyltransferase